MHSLLGHSKYISIREKAPGSTYVDNLCAARLKGARYTEKIQYIPAERIRSRSTPSIYVALQIPLSCGPSSEQERKMEKVANIKTTRSYEPSTPKYRHLSRKRIRNFFRSEEREREK